MGQGLYNETELETSDKELIWKQLQKLDERIKGLETMVEAMRNETEN